MRDTEKELLVWDAMPGTSAEIARRSGVGIGSVRKLLREWQDEGLVSYKTRWYGKLTHTMVYYKVT